MFKIDFGWCKLEKSKNCFCLCFCVRGLGPAYAACIHAYVALFLRLCVHGNRPVYAGSYLHTWALTRIHGTPSRDPTVPIFTSFSIVSLLYAILTPLFVIFASEHHHILLFIFILASKTPFFIIFTWIKNLMSSFFLFLFFFFFFFFNIHHPLMLVGEAPIR